MAFFVYDSPGNPIEPTVLSLCTKQNVQSLKEYENFSFEFHGMISLCVRLYVDMGIDQGDFLFVLHGNRRKKWG